MKTTKMALIGLVGALMLAPAGLADMNARVFLPLGTVYVDNPGVGQYDLAAPDDCPGRVGVWAAAEIVGFYYTHRFATNDGTTQVVPGTGAITADPTGCLGLVFPPGSAGAVLGLEDTTVKVGTFLSDDALLSATQFAVLDGTQSVEFLSCPVLDASVTPGTPAIATFFTADALVCASAMTMEFNATALATVTAPGSWGGDFDIAFLHEVFVGTGHVAMQHCRDATLSTLLGVETRESDQDHFFLFDSAALGGSTDVAALTWALTDTNWSNLAPNSAC